MKISSVRISLLKLVPFPFALVFLFSCSDKNRQQGNLETRQDSMMPPRVTVLADLPDSSKPKQTFLLTAYVGALTFFSDLLIKKFELRKKIGFYKNM